jgi:hypothetical protein
LPKLAGGEEDDEGGPEEKPEPLKRKRAVLLRGDGRMDL